MGVRKNEGGIVYLIRLDDKRFKIGTATDFKRRFHDLTASNPGIETIIAAYVQNRKAVEASLHQVFMQYHEEREIFVLPPEEVERAKEMITISSLGKQRETGAVVNKDNGGMVDVWGVSYDILMGIFQGMPVVIMGPSPCDGAYSVIPIQPLSMKSEERVVQLRHMKERIDSYFLGEKPDSPVLAVSSSDDGRAGKAGYSIDTAKTVQQGDKPKKKPGAKTVQKRVSKLSVGGLEDVRKAREIIVKQRHETQLATLKELREKNPLISISALAKELGVSRGTVSNLLHAAPSEGNLISLDTSGEVAPGEQHGE